MNNTKLIKNTAEAIVSWSIYDTEFHQLTVKNKYGDNVNLKYILFSIVDYKFWTKCKKYLHVHYYDNKDIIQKVNIIDDLLIIKNITE